MSNFNKIYYRDDFYFDLSFKLNKNLTYILYMYTTGTQHYIAKWFWGKDELGEMGWRCINCEIHGETVRVLVKHHHLPAGMLNCNLTLMHCHEEVSKTDLNPHIQLTLTMTDKNPDMGEISSGIISEVSILSHKLDEFEERVSQTFTLHDQLLDAQKSYIGTFADETNEKIESTYAYLIDTINDVHSDVNASIASTYSYIIETINANKESNDADLNSTYSYIVDTINSNKETCDAELASTYAYLVDTINANKTACDTELSNTYAYLVDTINSNKTECDKELANTYSYIVSVINSNKYNTDVDLSTLDTKFANELNSTYAYLVSTINSNKAVTDNDILNVDMKLDNTYSYLVSIINDNNADINRELSFTYAYLVDTINANKHLTDTDLANSNAYLLSEIDRVNKETNTAISNIYIPTKVSEFENDSNYQTLTEVNAAIKKVVGAAPEALDTLEEIANKLGDNDDAVAGIINTISSTYAYLVSTINLNKTNTDADLDNTYSYLVSIINSNKTKTDNDIANLETTISNDLDSTYNNLVSLINANKSATDLDIANLDSKVANNLDSTYSYLVSVINSNKATTDNDILNVDLKLDNTYAYLVSTINSNKAATDADLSFTYSYLVSEIDRINKENNNSISNIYIPTKVSEFENDSNYQTLTEVNAAIKKVVGAAPEALDTLEEIAAKLGDNDDAVAGIVNTISSTYAYLVSTINANKGVTDLDIANLGVAVRNELDATYTYLVYTINVNQDVANSNISAINTKVDSTYTYLLSLYNEQQLELDKEVSDLKTQVTSTYYQVVTEINAHKAQTDADITNIGIEVEKAQNSINITYNYVKDSIENVIVPAMEAIDKTNEKIDSNKEATDNDIANLQSYVDENYQPKGNYLTEHQSLDAYATVSYVSEEVDKTNANLQSTYSYLVGVINSNKNATDTEISDYKSYVDANYQPVGDYLTEHQDISNLVESDTFNNAYSYLIDAINNNKSDVDTEIAKIDEEIAKLDEKLDSSYSYINSTIESINKDLNEKIDSIYVPTKVSEFTNDSKYQTEDEVKDAIQKVVGAAPEALDTLEEIAAKLKDNDDVVASIINTLSDKVNTSELDNYATVSYVTEEIEKTNNSLDSTYSYLVGVINTNKNATDTDVANLKSYVAETYQPKGDYLTEHQSLDDYYTKSESENKFQPVGDYLTEHQSLENYVTYDKLNELLSKYFNVADEDDIMSMFAQPETEVEETEVEETETEDQSE